MNQATNELDPWIRAIKDFPKEGILFRDISPLLAEPAAFRRSIEMMATSVDELDAEVIIGIESRGFIFGAALALHLGLPFVPVRKPGKLPYKTRSVSYALEYGEDCIEIHEDALKKDERVLLVDDLLATGGTMEAAVKLVRELGAVPVQALFLIELAGLDGREKLDIPVRSLLSY